MVAMRDALRELPQTNQDHIQRALDMIVTHGSGIAQRIHANLEAELRIPCVIWRNIFESLLKIEVDVASHATADAIELGLRTGCTNSLPELANHPKTYRLPVGPAIPGLAPKAYGRLMALSQLSAYWKDAPRSRFHPSGVIFASDESVRKVIDEISSPDGYQLWISTGILANCPLGKYVMWSTFDADDLEADPFAPRSPKVGDLMALMGLDASVVFGADWRLPAELHGSCVLLRYGLPADVVPHVPTIIEAYAGTTRANYYFNVYQGEVDVARRLFPTTLPAPSAQQYHGVPEVVHEEIFANQLLRPLEVEMVQRGPS